MFIALELDLDILKLPSNSLYGSWWVPLFMGGLSLPALLLRKIAIRSGEDQFGVTCLRLQMVGWLPIRILRQVSVTDRTLAEKVGSVLRGLYGGIRQVQIPHSQIPLLRSWFRHCYHRPDSFQPASAPPRPLHFEMGCENSKTPALHVINHKSCPFCEVTRGHFKYLGWQVGREIYWSLPHPSVCSPCKASAQEDGGS